MIKFKHFAAVALSLATAFSLFSGCSLDSDSSKDTPGNTDVDSTLITIGETTVPFSVGKFYAYNEQASYEAYYLANGYTINWSSNYQEEVSTETETEEASATIEELVKKDVLDRIKMFYVVADYAKLNGVTLNDEDYSEIDEYVSNYLKGNQKVISATGATDELLKTIYEIETYYNKGCDLIFEGETFEVDDEEIRQCDIYAVEIYPEQIEFPKDTANAILNRVQAGEDITKVANAYGLECHEGNVGKGDFNGDSVEQLCLSLKDGEAGIASEDDAYLVIYCIKATDEDATKIARETAIGLLKSDKLQSFYDEYTKDMNITVDEALWSKISYTNTIFSSDDLQEILGENITTPANSDIGN